MLPDAVSVIRASQKFSLSPPSFLRSAHDENKRQKSPIMFGMKLFIKNTSLVCFCRLEMVMTGGINTRAIPTMKNTYAEFVMILS